MALDVEDTVGSGEDKAPSSVAGSEPSTFWPRGRALRARRPHRTRQIAALGQRGLSSSKHGYFESRLSSLRMLGIWPKRTCHIGHTFSAKKESAEL
jgi:hypothetical protein